MKVLIACEESQRVCTEFRNLGHEAYSCDIVDPSGGHPEWHIKQDVIPILNGRCSFKTIDGTDHTIADKWDLIIAFPPCTDLATSGARYFESKRANGKQHVAIEFFCQFLVADCNHIAIENPQNIISGTYIEQFFPNLCAEYPIPKKPSQIIQPWMFGDNYIKTTWLWLINLPKLIPTHTEQPEIEYHEYITESGEHKRENKYMSNFSKKDRDIKRSKTYPGIAKAMAEQWNKLN